MAEFNRAVLTNKGLALLAKAQADEVPIVITKVVSGSGEYEDGEDLMSRTELKEQVQSFAPTSIKRQNETNVFIRFSITNNPPSGPLRRGYSVREIGVIAEDPMEGEILYAIAVTEPGQGDYLPAYNDLMPTVIGVNFMIEVANADTVIIDTDISAYVTTEELEAKEIFWRGEEEKTIDITPTLITEVTEEGTKTTEFLPDGSIVETYPDGRCLRTVISEDGTHIEVRNYIPPNSGEEEEDNS